MVTKEIRTKFDAIVEHPVNRCYDYYYWVDKIVGHATIIISKHIRAKWEHEKKIKNQTEEPILEKVAYLKLISTIREKMLINDLNDSFDENVIEFDSRLFLDLKTVDENKERKLYFEM